MSKYINLQIRAYYDENTGTVNLISRDDKLKKKPFKVSLTKDSPSVESLFELLTDSGIINDDSLLHSMPNFLELPGSLDQRLNIHEENDNGKGNNGLIFHIGEDTKGIFEIDLDYAPHTLVCGSTGSGKSVFLRSIAEQASRNENISVWIASPVHNGMSHLSLRNGIDKVALSQDDIFTMFYEVRSTLNNRLKELEQQGVHSWGQAEDMKPVIFMVDEIGFFAPTGLKTYEGAAQDNMYAQYLGILNEVIRRGRAAGLYVFVSTQRPDAVLIPGEMKANMGRRILFGKAESNMESMSLSCSVNINNTLRRNPGRGVIRTYASTPKLFQSYIV